MPAILPIHADGSSAGLLHGSSPKPSHDPSHEPSRGAGQGGLPATGIVLIGTRRTCRYLAGQLAALREPAIPAGCVALSVLDGAGAATNTGGGLVDDVGILPPQLGTVDDLIGLHGRYQFRFALVCLPEDAPPALRTRLVQLLTQLEIAHRFVPTAEELILGRGGQDAANGDAASSEPAASPRPRSAPAVRPMLPEDIDPVVLIGRSGVTIDSAAVTSVIAGKTVLITGAGGSIGSQLAQIVAKFNPAGIVLMERAENALFQIDQVMGRRFAGVRRRCILHDVVERDATRRLLGELRPDVVFHAAAHKHVPLMEDHPSLALSNNLFGTAAIADAAAACGAERFVLISTDKAVNPSSAMGASKRLAELFIASRAAESAGSGADAGSRAGQSGHTIFSAVRFGNVLASACSVVPIWLQQMADGAPISVTDPRMTRYFMTIPEAASLVVQAAALQREAGSAPIFVLDMGRPIRILDLACRFVRMHGAVPRLKRAAVVGEGGARQVALDAAVQEIGGWAVLEASLGLGEDADGASVTIELTGARPGEKLYEELAYAREQLQPTSHAKINCQAAEGAADPAFADELLRALTPLRTDGADKVEVVRAMMAWAGGAGVKLPNGQIAKLPN